MSKTKFMDNKTVGMIGKFLNENAPTLAIGGAIGTLVGALYAAFKASQDVSSEKAKYDEKVQKIEAKGLSEADKATELKEAKSDRNVHYILAYKWVGLLGLASISLMITANALNGAKIATLTTLAVANQEKLKKLAENGKKMIEEEKWKEVEDKTLEDLISENFFGEDGPKAKRLSPRAGRLFIDTDAAIIFQAKEEDLNGALQRAKEYYNNNGHVLNQSKYFEMLGFVDSPENSKVKFWGPNNPFEAYVGTREYLGATIPSIEYKNPPTLAGAAGVGGCKTKVGGKQ